jgi:hypothetical protein
MQGFVFMISKIKTHPVVIGDFLAQQFAELLQFFGPAVLFLL